MLKFLRTVVVVVFAAAGSISVLYGLISLVGTQREYSAPPPELSQRAIDELLIGEANAQPAALTPLSVVSGVAVQRQLTPTAGFNKAFLYNEGPAEVFWAENAVATSGSIPLPPGCGVSIEIGAAPNSYISAITAASTATLRVIQGDTVPGTFCLGSATSGTYTFSGAVTSLPLPTIGITPQASADTVSNFVPTATGKKLYGFSVKNAATAGFAMLLDATVLPANGAVAPLWCQQMAAQSGVMLYPEIPFQMANGIVLAYSSTGCDSLTASATAKFSGVQTQ